MKNIGVLVGEDADLPKNKIQNLPISIFPFVVYRSKGLPKTSQPSVKTFEELFIKNLRIYQELLVITISSSLSGTYNSALQARKLFNERDQKRVHIVDSKISTGGEALIVLRIAEMVKSGESIKEILSKINQCISKTYLLGVFDNPKWLKRGGRINAVQSLVIENMLRAGFRPILTVKDGKIVAKKIQRERNKTKALFEQFKKEILHFVQDDIRVAITHADCEKDASDLKKLVHEFDKSIKIEFVNIISPVIGAHLGPGSLIISWMVN